MLISKKRASLRLIVSTFRDYVEISSTNLATSSLPVLISSPGRAMKVSLPQHLMKPWEKWGSPAARLATDSCRSVDLPHFE